MSTKVERARYVRDSTDSLIWEALSAGEGVAGLAPRWVPGTLCRAVG
jgi:hypothetical protein